MVSGWEKAKLFKAEKQRNRKGMKKKEKRKRKKNKRKEGKLIKCLLTVDYTLFIVMCALFFWWAQRRAMAEQGNQRLRSTSNVCERDRSLLVWPNKRTIIDTSRCEEREKKARKPNIDISRINPIFCNLLRSFHFFYNILFFYEFSIRSYFYL